MNKFEKILVANRGEIALRIIHAIHQLGKTAVAIYSDADSDLPFVQEADESYSLGSGTLKETYLSAEHIVEIAHKSNASAIHPGYGFLSEKAHFAALCKKNNISFIGPSVKAIDDMGNKANARQTAKELGVPVIEGFHGEPESFLEQKNKLPYPLLIKPSAGGGGKGMHIVNKPSELITILDDAVREAKNYFGSSGLYAERYLPRARHIEVQIMADSHGNVVHLFERECSLQRRYQKIIEEAPSPSVSETTRKKITESAVKLAKGLIYQNAGTVEFLMDEKENFFFIEMNTRIQVEHPVTELITGKDLVKEQILVAEGHELSFTQDDINIHGHAIEARIYAENPGNDFMPSTGKITALDHRDVISRIDEGFTSGNTVSSFYDPMLAKIVAWGEQRSDSIELLRKDIANYHVTGIDTNRSFLSNLLDHETFRLNKLYTRFIDENIGELTGKHKELSQIELIACLAGLSLLQDQNQGENDSVWSEIGHWRMLPKILMQFENEILDIEYQKIGKESFRFLIDGTSVEIKCVPQANNICHFHINTLKHLHAWYRIDKSEILIDLKVRNIQGRRVDYPDERYIRKSKQHSALANQKEVNAPLNGKIVKINTAKEKVVKKGETLLVIESMKMENKIASPVDAEIDKIHVKMDELVTLNQILITLK